MKQVFALLVIVALAIGGCNNSSPSQPATQSAVQSPAATATASPVTISLHAVDKMLNESGEATLQSSDDGTMLVTINVVNEPKGERQHVFLMDGTCHQLSGFGLYPLADLVDGRSVSKYRHPLASVLMKGPADGIGPGPGHSPMATPTPSGFVSPTSFAVTIWRYQLAHKTLVTCGDRALKT